MNRSLANKHGQSGDLEATKGKGDCVASAKLVPYIVASTLVAIGSVAAPAEASIRKGPYLQDVQASTANIRVEVDPPSAARVELSAVDGGAPVAKAVVDSPNGSFHVLQLDGLVPSTAYRARVTAGGSSVDVSLTTAPADASTAPFSFLLFGDNRTDDVAHAAVVRAIAQAPGDFLINTGDLVQEGSDPAQWQRFFDIEGSLLRDRCLFAAVGNHELVEETAANFLRYFGDRTPPPGAIPAPGAGSGPASGLGRLYRSMRWGNIRFFFLNGLDAFTSGAPADWLRDELKRRRDEPGVAWRIVVVHHGPWSSGPHGKNPRLLAAGAASLFHDAGIDLVFSGHDHIYERGDNGGTKYVVSGGGGAPLYKIKAHGPSSLTAEAAFHFVSVQVTPSALKLTAQRADGSLIETCGFAKGAPWDCPSKLHPASATVASASPGASSSAAKPASDVPVNSRCGCAVPGAPAPAAAWLAALGVALAGGARRLLRRDRRR